MAKKRKRYSPQFERRWANYNRNYLSAIHRGYTPQFTRPTKAEAWADLNFRRNLRVYSTPEYILEHSVYTTHEGVTVPATHVEEARRSASATRGALTREYYRELRKTPSTRLQDESNLPQNVEWDERTLHYWNRATNEVIQDISTLPSAGPIAMGNYIEQLGRRLFPTEIFQGLIRKLEDPEINEDWYRRKQAAKSASLDASQRLADKIREILSDVLDNEEYYRNLLDTNKTLLEEAVNKTIYGYSPEIVAQGYQDAVSILTGGKPGTLMPADVYALREDTYD